MDVEDPITPYNIRLYDFLSEYYNRLLGNPEESVENLYAEDAQSDYDEVIHKMGIKYFLHSYLKNITTNIRGIISTSTQEASEGIFHCCMKFKLSDFSFLFQTLVIQRITVPTDPIPDQFFITKDATWIDTREFDLHSFSLCFRRYIKLRFQEK